MKRATTRFISCCTSAILVGVILGGCNRFASGKRERSEIAPQQTTEKFSIISKPAGANARLSTGERCTTPCSLTKRSNEKFAVTFEKEGYHSATVNVVSNLDRVVDHNRLSNKDRAELEQDWAGRFKLTPNPASVVLEPEWTR